MPLAALRAGRLLVRNDTSLTNVDARTTARLHGAPAPCSASVASGSRGHDGDVRGEGASRANGVTFRVLWGRTARVTVSAADRDTCS